MRILVFGDSITYGHCDMEGGWTTRLKKYLYGINQDIELYNFGVSGDTTKGLIKRFETDLKPRLEPPTIFIFAIGINDSQELLKENNQTKVSLYWFRANLKKLISMAKKYSSKIIFLGLTPVEEDEAADEESLYRNQNIKKYDSAIKEICTDNNVYYINILNQREMLDYKTLLEDGLHPDLEGNRIMAERFARVLGEMLPVGAA